MCLSGWVHGQTVSTAATPQTPAITTGNPVTASEFDELAQKAAAAREQDQTGEAIAYYEKALGVRPQWTEGWWYLGTLYAASDRHSEAVSAFKKVVNATPRFGPGWASLGLSQYEAKDFHNSFDALLRAQELRLDEAPQLAKTATYHLALLFNVNGRFEDAWELLGSNYGKTDMPAQVKTALALALLRVPLLPEQIGPSKDALIDMAGETAALLVGGRFEQALQLFQRMLRDYPDTPFLHYAYGSALDFRQQYDEAAVQLREQVQLTPRSTVAHLRLGAVLLKLHRPEEALPIARRAVQLDPGSAISHQLLGRILTGLGQVQAGAREMEAAKTSGPQKYEVDSDVAKAYLAGSGHAANPAPAASFVVLAEKATTAKQAGHTSEAILYYQDALKDNAAWEQGWADLGVLLYAAGRFAEAVPALTTSLGLNRNRAEAWVFLGLSEFETKDYQNSFLHLERGRELGFHGTPEAQRVASYCLAQLRNLNGDFDGAIDLLTSGGTDQLREPAQIVLGMALLRVPLLAGQIDASKAGMLQVAGRTAALLRQQKYDETFRGFEQMLKDYPDTPFLHYAYGAALQTFSRFDEAQAQFKEEIRISPQSALPHLRLALIALTLHHPDEAAAFAQHGVELDPDAAGTHELLGRALLEMGKVEDSVRELEAASRLAPSYPEVHFDLARAYAKAKMTEKAERERAIFAELSAAAEQESVQHGTKAYGSPHNESGSISERSTPKPASSRQ